MPQMLMGGSGLGGLGGGYGGDSGLLSG